MLQQSAISRKHNGVWHLRKILPHILLIIFAIVAGFPFLFLLTTSFKSPANVMKIPPQWIPNPFVPQNYYLAVTTIPFFRYFFNTCILAIGPIPGEIIGSSLVAYSFAKVHWKWRNKLFAIVLATMMLPTQVTMIPIYLIWTKMHLINTFTPLILPSIFGTAFNIFLLRQFFLTVPDSYLDAARIDGAGELRIYASIMLPLSKPVLTTIAIFTFQNGWNNFMGPLMYLNNSTKWPIAIGLQSFLFQNTQRWELLMAATVLFTIPMIVIFFIGQKQFIKGIVMTGFK